MRLQPVPSVSRAAAAAFSAYVSRDSSSTRRVFQHLTADRLEVLQTELELPASDLDPLLAIVLLRRIVHNVLDKRASFGDVGSALNKHGLTDTVEELKTTAGESREALWRLVMEHRMTSYVPMQCQHCGYVVPDATQPGQTDADIGLSEETPTEEEEPLVRAGWYRGPRGRVVFVLTCPKCNATSRWFRSSTASVTLNPNRWGRLCGEQEDARAALAEYLHVPLRVAIPLDWDHVWSEYLRDDSQSWAIYEGRGDAPAANFAKRLDEGIGAWSGVLVIGSDPSHCCDITEEYLACQPAGRASESLASEMLRFNERVKTARADATGLVTQARSINGHLIYVRAGFTSQQVTAILQRAVEEHGRLEWWEV